MDTGALVSDDIIIGLVKERLRAPDTANGYLFDGFPRTIPQAEAMKDADVKLDYVLEIDVPQSDIIERMSGRRVHRAERARVSREVQSAEASRAGTIVTGEPLIQRDDDKEDTVRKRLAVYRDQTSALVDYYSDLAASGNAEAPKYRRISGVGSVDEIKQRVSAALAS